MTHGRGLCAPMANVATEFQPFPTARLLDRPTLRAPALPTGPLCVTRSLPTSLSGPCERPLKGGRPAFHRGAPPSSRWGVGCAIGLGQRRARSLGHCHQRPWEGRHLAFHSADRRFPKGGTSALTRAGKARCLPSQGPSPTRGSPKGPRTASRRISLPPRGGVEKSVLAFFGGGQGLAKALDRSFPSSLCRRKRNSFRHRKGAGLSSPFRAWVDFEAYHRYVQSRLDDTGYPRGRVARRMQEPTR